MSSHDHFSKFSKQYFRNFFKRWHQEWGVARPFFFIHQNSKHFELVFVDEIPDGAKPITLEDGLRLNMKMRACRVQSGCTQKAWAEKLGVSPSNISKIERGERIPSSKFIRKFQEVMESQNSTYEDPVENKIADPQNSENQTEKKRHLPGVEDDRAILNWLKNFPCRKMQKPK